MRWWRWYDALTVAAMATLTVFSYYTIEMPFHEAAGLQTVPPP